MDEPILPQEGTNPEPVVEVTETTTEETVETPVPEEKTYTQAEWDELHGRATKAEAKLKASQPPKPARPIPAPPQASVEETVLLANGMSEELLGELKVVAAMRKTSLIKAQNDPIFIAVKEKSEKDQKQKDASLPASRGAGGVKPKKDLTTPGLTREEHMQMVKNL